MQRVEERMEEHEVAEEVEYKDVRPAKRVKVDHPTSQGYSR